jgi:hypothetical protein
MGERTRRVGLAIAIAALVALGAGCSSTPKTYGPCHHVIIYPGQGGSESGFMAAYDWDDEVHAYGEAVPLTGCFAAPTVVIPEGPPGVTFDPVQQQGAGEFGVVTFTVTVPEGSSGPIFVRLDYTEGDTWANPPGPVITPSGDGWKFTAPDMS